MLGSENIEDRYKGGAHMAKKALEQLSETMFYVLMAFLHGEWCGSEAAAWIEDRTRGRIRMGPGTLYTILAQFEDAGVLAPTETQGRRRHYCITDKGRTLYASELERLRQCIADAEGGM